MIDKILERSKLCLGANPLGWDRLFKGNKEKAAFCIALSRERAEMMDALNVAAVTMQNMDGELNELRAAVKASGETSMQLGEKRK